MTPAYAYYPGCSQTGSSEEYGRSVQICCRELGVELVEIEDWNCCGATPAHTLDPALSGALSARNLQLAAQAGRSEVATACPSCLANLKSAEAKARDPKSAKEMNRLLDEPYAGGVRSRSILQILLEDAGLKALQDKIKRNLRGLVLAPYYGCLTTRPGSLMEFDDPENPTSMDRLLETAGARVPDFPFKTECCGASLGVPRRDAVTRLSARILDMAAEAGADAIVVACPLCHQNLDMRRAQVNAASGAGHRMPVLFFTQALGIALGYTPNELGLDKLIVSPKGLLTKLQTLERGEG